MPARRAIAICHCRSLTRRSFVGGGSVPKCLDARGAESRPQAGGTSGTLHRPA